MKIKLSDNDKYVELIRRSFKKLKSAIFFDKTQLVLRDKLIAYETSSDFEKNLNDLALKMLSSDWKEIINSVGVLSFPKKVVRDAGKTTDNKQFITNVVNKATDIDEIQCFLDMDVEGYILGVAWLLVIGYKIDGEIYEHSYGNRMRKNVINDSGEATYSPYLFEPYFQQYESWRDTAINYAQKSLNKNQDVVVLMLDFKRFFYQVDISEDELKKYVSEIVLNSDVHLAFNYEFISSQLTNFVWKVIEKYSEKIRSKHPDLVGERNVLPIGFLPSNVLANYALKKFDDTIINGWNPIYYGRYVDDIILVEKIEKNSHIYQKAKKGELTAEDVIKYYLTNCSAWMRGDCLCEKNTSNGLLNGPDSDDYYRVNSLYNQFSKSDILVQNDKVKIFYFNSAESDALLSCFREHLNKNKSEFRFLPEDESVFQKDDYTEIYNLNEAEGPNKLRGVNGIEIDKFMLSKYLGKYTRISGLVKDKVEKKFEKDVEKIFTYRTVIENYLLWEKVLEIFVINGRYDAYVKFIKKITIALDNLRLSQSLVAKDVTNETINELQKTLQRVLYSAVYRTLSLVWGKEISQLQDSIYEACELPGFISETVHEMRKGYCVTRMCDKYAIVVPVDCFLEDSKLFMDERTINFTDFSSIKDLEFSFGCLESESEVYAFYPFLMTMNDLGVLNQLMRIKTSNGNTSNDAKYIEDLKRQYKRLNYLTTSDKNDIDTVLEATPFLKSQTKPGLKKCDVIKVYSKQLEEIKIAVANTVLFESDFDKVLKDLPNRKYSRYDKFQTMVNEAISQKADLLVLPEGYLPFEWLPILTRTCAKNQMAVVTGIEHFKISNKNGEPIVSNLTAVILPFVEGDHKFSYVHFHNKVHLAPHEKEKIESYRCIANNGDCYELYNWNDFWFSVYCCYELTSIYDRSMFQAYADAVIAVEWNKDTNYYSNIVESLSRDLHCFCVQVNTSEFGDSRITTPSKTESKDLLKVKGGKNSTILIDTIDVMGLRNFQLKGHALQEKSADGQKYKPTPPAFDYDVVNKKIHHKLWDDIANR